jgi:ubiquinone/menaquinone biosynthesis C-methylase UbiE
MWTGSSAVTPTRGETLHAMKPCKSRRAPTHNAVLLLICVDATEFIGWCAAISGMNSDEYANLDRVEQSHWYYTGKRKLVSKWIERIRPLAASDTLLDCGAGTGRFGMEMSKHCRVVVLDDHEESLQLLRERFPAENVLTLDTEGRVPLPDESVDCITALDVLEHTPDDRAVVAGFRRLLRPGGVAVITVPASMALWSDWDESLHHYRRYSRGGLRALFPEAEWELIHINYTNVPVFPVVWLARRWRKWFPAKEGAARPEDKVPGRMLNAFLEWIFVMMAMSRISFPFGVSLLLIARSR